MGKFTDCLLSSKVWQPQSEQIEMLPPHYQVQQINGIMDLLLNNIEREFSGGFG